MAREPKLENLISDEQALDLLIKKVIGDSSCMHTETCREMIKFYEAALRGQHSCRTKAWWSRRINEHFNCK